ncbi:MAG: DNA polymerase III subunit beta [Saprospiraceae bacterium]|jgi:DNA polymerase-3 subunit beta|nr:DNA polymerase III subunit beta [Saprospiraceae bacterium]
MKFSVSSSDLLKHLQTVGGVISSNPVIPILEDFLFILNGNHLQITATDTHTSITSEMSVNMEEEGSVAIPAKILLDTLKALPAQPIQFNIDNETMGVEITSSFGRYRLAGEKSNDFPKIVLPDEVDVISLPSTHLTKAIANTLFATSNDELRPHMCGVYTKITNESLTFVATDAHKLVKYTFNDIQSELGTNFILPKKALNLLKNILPVATEVKISFNSINAIFSFDNVQLSCRLVDGKYPDYNVVIPIENPLKMTLNRLDFLNSVKRIYIYANKTSNQIVLNINENALTVSAQDIDFSNEAAEQLPCTFEGDPLTIAFNAKYLSEMLGIIDSEEIVMAMSKPNKAGLILPVDAPIEENLLMLIMPVMIPVAQ